MDEDQHISNFRHWRKNSSPYFNSGTIRMEEVGIWSNMIEAITKEQTIKKVLEILRTHPRSDNYSINKKLVSVDSVIREQIWEILTKESEG